MSSSYDPRKDARILLVSDVVSDAEMVRGMLCADSQHTQCMAFLMNDRVIGQKPVRPLLPRLDAKSLGHLSSTVRISQIDTKFV